MKFRLFSKPLWVVVAAGLCIAGSWRVPDLRQTLALLGTSSSAECSFQSDPDRYQNALQRRMESLSRVTGLVWGNGRHALAASPGRKTSFVSPVPSRGYIDDHILTKMREDRVPHAPISSDTEFLRRVTLDLTGRIPSEQTVRDFLGWDDPGKRSAMVEALLASPEFVDKWTMFFGDLLRNTAYDGNIALFFEGRNAFYEKIHEFVASAMPYDVFVKNVITANDSNWENGYSNWIVSGLTPMGPMQDTFDTLAARSDEQFLGLSSFDCILCHSGSGHLESLNAWAAGTTREQAWEMAAFFPRTAFQFSGILENGRYYFTIRDAGHGNYNLTTTDGNRPARTPSGNGPFVEPRYIFSEVQAEGSTYRERFANNLTRDRQFARATVNYLWREMMGMGIVEPADQFDLARLDPSNLPSGWTQQPSHPALLEALADDFIHSGFSIRHIFRQIANSSTYQLSSRFPGEWRLEYTPYFARKYARRLWAEEVLDAVGSATGFPHPFLVLGYEPQKVVYRAMQLPETGLGVRFTQNYATPILDAFLRGDRGPNLRSGEASVLQALNMMNHGFVTSRVLHIYDSKVAALLSDEALTDAERVESIFLSTLSRFPTSLEAEISLRALKRNRTEGLEDLQWALLNKVDFLYR